MPVFSCLSASKRLPSSTKFPTDRRICTMNNTAKQIDENPIDVEGLDEIFDATSPADADDSTTAADSDATTADKIEVIADSQTTSAEVIEWLTTSQAAAHLGKSERTIQRYAKKGKLKSKTDDSGKLLIGVNTPAGTSPADDDKVASKNDTQDSSCDNVPPGDDSSTRVADTIFEKVIDDYQSQISMLQSKLESSTYQLGRLQAELEYKDKEIKLLTDKKLELTKWQKFKKWFIGG